MSNRGTDVGSLRRGCAWLISCAMFASAAALFGAGAGAAEPAKAPAPAKKQPAKPAKETVPAEPELPAAGTVEVVKEEVNLPKGRSSIVRVGTSFARVSIADDKMADVRPVTNRQLYILGKERGSTNIFLWDKKNHLIGIVEVNVSRDFGALNSEIRKLSPQGDIRVRSMGESIVLEGKVADARTASRASDLAESFVGERVVNMLTVEGVHQVLLEVKIAEVNRTLAEKLGIKFGVSHPSSSGFGFAVLADFLSNAAQIATVGSPVPVIGSQTSVGAITGVQQAGATLPGLTYPPISTAVPSGPALVAGSRAGATNWILSIDAEKRDGLIKILAEPNILAMSGQEGSFLSGGEILVPVQQGFGAVSLEEKQFGIGLRFTPTVLEGGRISMRVVPEVSTIVSFTSIAGTGVGGNVVVPTFAVRRASTTVELMEGQSLAIGGLLQDDIRETVSRFPVLGEVPILGALFRSSEYQKLKTELLIVVTPRLVKPLPPNYALPGDNFKEPSRAEFFLEGRMEAKPPEQAPPASPPPAAEPPSGGQGGHQLK